MKDTYLIQLLKTFSALEIKELKKYVRSPFLNNRTILVDYFDLLSKAYPRFDAKWLNEKYFFSKLYPHKKYTEGTIRKLTSFMLDVAKNYLSYKSFISEKFYSSMFLLSELNVRKLDSLFGKKLKEIEAEYFPFQGNAEEYFRRRYSIEREKNSRYMITQNDHLASESLLNRTAYLIYHYLVMLCKNSISLYIHEKNFKADFSKSDFMEFCNSMDLDKFISHLKNKNNEFYPILALHYYEMLALTKPENTDYFKQYRNLLKTEIGKYSYIEKINFYTITEAICTLNIERGNTNYKYDLFITYTEMLKLGLYSFTENGEFMIKLFRNIIISALSVKELSWLENFLRDYSEKLPKKNRASLLDFGYALLRFEQGRFEDSLMLLSKINYEIFHFKIDIRILYLKLYYELGYIEEAYSKIDSFRHFLSSNRFISERYREICIQFINSVQKLLNLKYKNDDFESEQLKKETLNLINSPHKDWILEKFSYPPKIQ